MNTVKGAPEDTVWAPIKVSTTAKIAGVQVSVTIDDTTVADIAEFDTYQHGIR